jgi:hypothetical protein
MTGKPMVPIPEDPRAGLRSLLRDHGQRWEIQLMRSYWQATSHPSPSQTVVHCADSLDELRSKIEGDVS